MADERFRIIFEAVGEFDPTLKKLEQAFTRIGGLDPFKALNESIRKTLDGINTVTGSSVAAFSAMTKAVEMLAATVGKVPEATTKVSVEMKAAEETTKRTTVSVLALGGAFSAVSRAATTALGSIGTHLRAAEEGVGRAIGGTLSGLGGKLGSIATRGLEGNVFSSLIEHARSAVAGVLSAVQGITTGTLKAVQSAVGALGSLWGDLEKGAATAAGSIVGVIGGALGGFPAIGALVGSSLGGAVGAILKSITDVKTGLLSAGLGIAQGVVDLGSGVIQAGVNVGMAALNALATAAQNVVEGLGRAVSGIVEKVAGLAGEAVSKATLAVTGLAGVAGTQSVRFRDAMALAFGDIKGLGTTTFEDLTARVREVMSESPFISWEEAAKGLRFMFRGGVTDVDQAMEALRSGVEATLAGGGTNLGEVMKAQAGLMSTYGLGGKDAGDLLAAIDKFSTLDIPDLVTGLGTVVVPAKLAGASVEEMAAAISEASFTLLNPERTLTAIARLFTGLSDPAAAGRFARIGMSIRTTAGELRSFRDILEELRGKNLKDTQLAELFPEQRERLGAAALLGRPAGSFDAALANLGPGRAGLATGAAEDVRARLGAQLSETWSAWTGLVDRIVARIEGPLTNALQSLQGYLREITQSSGFDQFADAIGGGLARAVAAVEGSIRFVVNHWDVIAEKARGVFAATETAATTTWGVLKTTYGLVFPAGVSAEESALVRVWSHVESGAKKAWDVIREYAAGNVEPLKIELDALWDFIVTRGKQAWQEVAGFAALSFSSLLKFVGPALETAYSTFLPSGMRGTIAGMMGVALPEVPQEERKTAIRNEVAGIEALQAFLAAGPPDESMIDRYERLRVEGKVDRDTLHSAILRYGGERGYFQTAGEYAAGAGELDTRLAALRDELAAMPTMLSDVTEALDRFGTSAKAAADLLDGEFRLRGVGRDFERSMAAVERAIATAAKASTSGILESAVGPFGAVGATGVSGQPGPPAPPPLSVRITTSDPFAETQQIEPPTIPVVRQVLEGPHGDGDRHRPRAVTADVDPFGIGGPPMGVSLSSMRSRAALDATRRKLLGALSPERRSGVLDSLPEQYSLQDLRKAIKSAGTFRGRAPEGDGGGAGEVAGAVQAAGDQAVSAQEGVTSAMGEVRDEVSRVGDEFAKATDALRDEVDGLRADVASLADRIAATAKATTRARSQFA